VICVFTLKLPATGQKNDYSGVWKLNRDKSTVPLSPPVLIKITVQIKGDSLLTERIYDTGDGEGYPFNENVTLDGKENNLNVYNNIPGKIKASLTEKDGLINVESVSTFEGSNGPEVYVSKEIWKIEKSNGFFFLKISCPRS
jgi:hypothetical protein